VNEPAGQADMPMLDVLVVEDNASSQRLFAGILEAAGHRVRIAVNGLEAIRGFLHKQPDMVVIDLQMPVLDGLQATPMLRALAGRHVPIIATTARTGSVDRERFLAAGVDSFLPKPFEARTLRRLVAELWASVEPPAPRGESMRTESCESAAVAPPIDIAGALVRLGGHDELLDDLIRFFFEDAFPLLEKIHCGVASQDWDGSSRAAHSLKGLAANFGAAPAVTALQAIENWEGGFENEIEALMCDVDREVARLAGALADYADGKSAARDGKN
jgi:two-component system sensor histidine kinase/response regulator